MKKIVYLFGGFRPWNTSNFHAVDDRVRKGASQSYLEPVGFGTIAHFHGNLDPSILGAGFASQVTWLGSKPGDVGLDLSKYDGLIVSVYHGLGDTFSINLSNKIGKMLDPSTGKRESTVNYHHYFKPNVYSEFDLQENTSVLPNIYQIPWSEFKPYYRGKPVEEQRERLDPSEVPPLDTKDIKSLAIMIASGFGEQKGKYSLYLKSIAAYKKL